MLIYLFKGEKTLQLHFVLLHSFAFLLWGLQFYIFWPFISLLHYLFLKYICFISHVFFFSFSFSFSNCDKIYLRFHFYFGVLCNGALSPMSISFILCLWKGLIFFFHFFSVLPVPISIFLLSRSLFLKFLYFCFVSFYIVLWSLIN